MIPKEIPIVQSQARRLFMQLQDVQPEPLTQPMTEPEAPPAPEITARRERSWAVKFAVAWRGLKLGIRGQSSFFVHFFFAVLVVAVAVVFSCALWEWCVLLGCIGLVFTAELFNSTIETLFRGLDPQTKERTWPALDIAAGAVLMASITAAILGTLIFGLRLLRFMGYVLE
jgi:diacylglycerol kinase